MYVLAFFATLKLYYLSDIKKVKIKQSPYH